MPSAEMNPWTKQGGGEGSGLWISIQVGGGWVNAPDLILQARPRWPPPGPCGWYSSFLVLCGPPHTAPAESRSDSVNQPQGRQREENLLLLFSKLAWSLPTQPHPASQPTAASLLSFYGPVRHHQPQRPGLICQGVVSS